LSVQKPRDENADLRAMESELIRELIRLYRHGTDYETFWQRVGRVELLSRLRRNFCQG
jgi:hypothetical protein